MPKQLEKTLKKAASKQGLKGAQKDAYVYGTLRKTGWKPPSEQKAASKKRQTRSTPKRKKS